MGATITPEGLYRLCQAGRKVLLVDVRTPAEFRSAHVEFARNMPLERFDVTAMLAERRDAGREPAYVICQSGGRGRQACEQLAAAGCTDAINVEGGTAAWIAAGLPVVAGKQTISLERQVRIAAGSLVLISALLGLFVSVYWIGLAAIVGAGLIFAGVTDRCGMALLLARMPWNQVRCGADEGNASAGACCGR